MIRPRDTCSQSHSASVSVVSLSVCVCLSVRLSVSHMFHQSCRRTSIITSQHKSNRVQKRELRYLLLRCQHGSLLLIDLLMYVKHGMQQDSYRDRQDSEQDKHWNSMKEAKITETYTGLHVYNRNSAVIL